MKKTLYILLISCLFTNISVTPTFGVGTDNGYKEPIIKSELNFSAVLNNSGQVEMSWNQYAPSGFNYYKVIRSLSNAEPVYPDDGYIAYFSDTNITGYTDNEVPEGTVYYRVCSVARPERYCSNVVAINNYEPSNHEPFREGYDAQIMTNRLNFSVAIIEAGKVGLSWSKAHSEGFSFYEVLRSDINPQPVFPFNGLFKSFSMDENMVTVDAHPLQVRTYYRVCSIAKPEVLCSPAATVDLSKNTINFTETIDKKEDFYDIKLHSYYEAINYLIGEGVVTGYEENGIQVYKPEQEINRAEFLKILIEAKFGPTVADDAKYQKDCFSDIEIFANQEVPWYIAYACFAKENGIIGGYPDGSLKPDRAINFAEAAKILVNVYALNTAEIGGQWYAPFVKTLQDNNYIPPSVYTEDKKINRGEMAELIWRIKNQITDKDSKSFIMEPVSASLADYNGWQKYQGDGYGFYYPGNWYKGAKRGWDYLSEEKDYIDNLNTPNYMDVDTYVAVYTVQASASVPDSEALRTNVYFDHPEIEALDYTINGLAALRRKFRAPSGTVVNGRSTGENEIIIIYTYRNGTNVHVLQFFNAAGREDYGVENFDKIARSLMGG